MVGSDFYLVCWFGIGLFMDLCGMNNGQSFAISFLNKGQIRQIHEKPSDSEYTVLKDVSSSTIGPMKNNTTIVANNKKPTSRPGILLETTTPGTLPKALFLHQNKDTGMVPIVTDIGTHLGYQPLSVKPPAFNPLIVNRNISLKQTIGQGMSGHVQNKTDVSIFRPIFSGTPGMLGSGQQNNGRGSTNYEYPVIPQQTIQEVNMTTVGKPLYSGYPGMLGFYVSAKTANASPFKSLVTHNGDNATLNQWTTVETYSPNFVGNRSQLDSDGIIPMPIQTEGVWKGEWPGRSNKTGSTMESWTNVWKSDSQGYQSQGMVQSKSTSWDGSWPDLPEPSPTDKSNSGARPREPTTSSTQPRTQNSNLSEEVLTETVDALKAILAVLETKFQDSQSLSGSQHKSDSYSTMVQDWLKHVHP